jgi:hypothetical protein
MAKLTEDQKLAAMGFLNDLFIAGGILDKADSKRADSVSNYIAERTASDAKVVCDEIKFRSFDFFNVDNALRVPCLRSGWFWVKAQGADHRQIHKKASTDARKIHRVILQELRHLLGRRQHKQNNE